MPHTTRPRTAARTSLTATVLLAAAACADGTGAVEPLAEPTALGRPVAQAIPGQYIVVLREAPDAPPAAGGATLDRSPVGAPVDGATFQRLAQARVAALGGRLQYSYTRALRGYAAALSDSAVRVLRADPAVAYVEADQEVTVTTTQTNPVWGIDRIDDRSLPRDNTYTYTATGSGVRIYVIDTGILTSHSQFGGRASAVFDAFGGSGQDCNGHGTHVAGTAGGSTYGVAKGAYLRAVRVLNCSGSGSNSGVIAGIDWVAANHISPAVANMSLGGGYSQATNDAVARLANSGVFVAVAAGNENQNACNVSPASAPVVTTVAASTSSDARASYSNYGSCVDLYGPGSGVTSAWYTSTTATNTISGTSMATPHVAGVAALYKSAAGDASQATVDAWLKNNATANVITGNPAGTPNRLLYKGTL